MGSGAAQHGGSVYTGPSWDEMSPEQKEDYLEQKRQVKIRLAQYEEEERKRKIKNGILVGIGVVIVLGLLILLTCCSTLAFHENWKLSQQVMNGK